MTYDNQEFTRPYGTPTARVFNYRMPHGKQGRLVIAAAIVAAVSLVTAESGKHPADHGVPGYLPDLEHSC